MNNKLETLFHLDVMAIIILLLALITIIIHGSLAFITLFMLMLILGSVLILGLSKEYRLIKLRLFIFFFSFYLLYVVAHDYIMISISPDLPPFDFVDETTFYHYSNIALPYIEGEKNFFNIFTDWKLPFYDVALHTVFSALIAYLSLLIDGTNTVMVQKLLSPFLGGLFSTVLYSTLKYQFKETGFALKATIVYGFFSAVFMYSTPLLRDIDIALAYILFIYIFLQKNSYKNFFLLFLIAFTTVYLRIESGIMLFALILLYNYLHIRNIQNISVKFISYIVLFIIFSFVILLEFHKIIEMIIDLSSTNMERAASMRSKDSIAALFNKLPFGISHTAKVLFGQMKPFPFLNALNKPPEVISGLFWPFIFIMMGYAWVKKNIRVEIDIKIKYLLIFAIAVLFLMSSEPNTRRMMSVYPIMYMTALYVFYFIEIKQIKKIFSYYIFGMLTLHTLYYFMKIR